MKEVGKESDELLGWLWVVGFTFLVTSFEKVIQHRERVSSLRLTLTRANY